MTGDIQVFSKKDKGSCFIFCLPIDTAPDQHEHLTDVDTLKTRISNKKLRALIVDDVPFNQMILANFFEKLSIEVIGIAENGREAYESYIKYSKARIRPHIVCNGPWTCQLWMVRKRLARSGSMKLEID